MSDSYFITCSHCQAKNRVPIAKIAQTPLCGKCKEPVLTASPIELSDVNFGHFIANNDMPIVVDFWASWCGPCQMMAPVFASTSATMANQIRFAKVNTEVAQQVSAQYGIRSIPTLIVFQQGREVARQAGAMDGNSLQHWLKQFC